MQLCQLKKYSCSHCDGCVGGGGDDHHVFTLHCYVCCVFSAVEMRIFVAKNISHIFFLSLSESLESVFSWQWIAPDDQTGCY